MKSYTNEQLMKQYEKLPQDAKDVILNSRTIGDIRLIGGKFNLINDKIAEITDETGLVILGLTHPRDFASNLVKRLVVDEATAGKISEEINSQIFSKVKESLEKIHSASEGPSFTDQGRSLEKGVGKDEILQEIERDHSADIVSQPVVSKVEPLKEIKYPAGDPYKEPI